MTSNDPFAPSPQDGSSTRAGASQPTVVATAVDQRASAEPVERLPASCVDKSSEAVGTPTIEQNKEKPPTTPARAGRGFDPFSRHADAKERRPRPVRTQVPPAERLMAWLPRWPKATISVRDVRLFGPNSLRNPEIATDAIEVLADYGWLVPVMTRQRNMLWWQIRRGRDPVVATPGVAEP
jgi:hypothetical protein